MSYNIILSILFSKNIFSIIINKTNHNIPSTIGCFCIGRIHSRGKDIYAGSSVQGS